MTVDEDTVLKQGSAGDRVRLIQNMLNTLGYYLGQPDGIYGARTVRAVRQFQIVWGLDVNGEVGRQTLETLASRFDYEAKDTVVETPVRGQIALAELNGDLHPENDRFDKVNAD